MELLLCSFIATMIRRFESHQCQIGQTIIYLAMHVFMFAIGARTVRLQGWNLARSWGSTPEARASCAAMQEAIPPLNGTQSCQVWNKIFGVSCYAKMLNLNVRKEDNHLDEGRGRWPCCFVEHLAFCLCWLIPLINRLKIRQILNFSNPGVKWLKK